MGYVPGDCYWVKDVLGIDWNCCDSCHFSDMGYYDDTYRYPPWDSWSEHSLFLCCGAPKFSLSQWETIFKEKGWEIIPKNKKYILKNGKVRKKNDSSYKT